MKLQEILPEGVTVDGKFYRCDFDFRNVLKMIDTLDRDDLMPEAKAYKALKFVQKRPKNCVKVIQAIKDLLFQKGGKSGPKLTDFEQDASLIRAAFRQAYGIDLYRDRLHWLEFVDLFGAIPEGTRLYDVISIRSRPLPAPNQWNQKEREWLIRAKADVALKVKEPERAERYRNDVKNVADMLLMMAKGG